MGTQWGLCNGPGPGGLSLRPSSVPLLFLLSFPSAGSHPGPLCQVVPQPLPEMHIRSPASPAETDQGSR